MRFPLGLRRCFINVAYTAWAPLGPTPQHLEVSETYVFGTPHRSADHKGMPPHLEASRDIKNYVKN